MSEIATAFVWSQTLADTLFKAENRRLQVRLEGLCKQQQQLTDQTHLGFLYDGTWYVPKKQLNPVPVGSRQMLHMSLCDEMEAFKADRTRVRMDYDEIRQTLAKLLIGQSELQDIRDALPDCVVHFDPNLSRLNRQRDEAHSIRTDHRAWRQYQKALPKMAMYAATHLIY